MPQFTVKNDISRRVYGGNTPTEIIESLRGQWGEDNLEVYIERFAKRIELGYGVDIPTSTPAEFVGALLVEGILVPVDEV